MVHGEGHSVEFIQLATGGLINVNQIAEIQPWYPSMPGRLRLIGETMDDAYRFWEEEEYKEFVKILRLRTDTVKVYNVKGA